MDNNKLIQQVVDSSCKLSIWNPCPQSISWGNECDKEMGDSEDELLTDANKRMEMVKSRRYMPTFQTTSGGDEGKGDDGEEDNYCTNWKQLTPSLIGYGKDQISKGEAYNIVPKYSNSNTNFRFCIILGGPPGSGKGSVLAPQLKKTASSINNDAAKKTWIQLGHDQIICNDFVFKHTINRTQLKPRESDGPINIEEIKDSILSSSDNEWKDIIKRQNKLYNERKGNIIDKNDVRKKCIEIVKMIMSDDEIMRECKSLITSINDGLLSLTINKFINKDKPQSPNKYDDDGEEIRDISNMYYITNTELLYIKTGLCFVLGFNITYESTLKSVDSMNYLFELANKLTDECKSFNYIFLLGYSIVDYDTLLDRILNRYKKWGDVSLERRERVCSVGLPNLLDSTFKDDLINSYLTIASIIWFCIGPENTCPGIGVDRILIYDNTNELPKKFSYTISTSARSRKLVPIGLFRDPVIQKRTKRLLITVLMKNMNSINNSCPSTSAYRLPQANKIKVGDDTFMSEIHDMDREEDRVRSFENSDFTVLQLKSDLDDVGKGDLLNNINVLYAFENLITTVNIKSSDKVLTRYEELKILYGFGYIREFLECIDTNSPDKNFIEKTIDTIQENCKKNIVANENIVEEKTVQANKTKPMIEILNTGGGRKTRKIKKRAKRRRRKTRVK